MPVKKIVKGAKSAPKFKWGSAFPTAFAQELDDKVKAEAALQADASLALQAATEDLQDAELVALIDEVGDLKAKVDEFQATIGKEFGEKFGLLKEQVAEGLTPKNGRTLAGNRYRVELSPAAKKRVVKNIAVAFKLLGKATFLKIASLPLGALDKYLTPEEAAQIIEDDPAGGARTLKLERRPEE